MLESYYAYGILILLGIGLAGALSAVAFFLGPKKHTPAKDQPFESGLDYLPSAKTVHVKFYQVAVVFLLFDVEVALLFPAVPLIKSWGLKGFIVLLPVLLLIALGVCYEWLEKLLDW